MDDKMLADEIERRMASNTVSHFAFDREQCSQIIASLRAPAARDGVLRDALRFYARGEHFHLSDSSLWDTVSGEPQNYWCDEAGSATVEDGTIAKMSLRGKTLDWEGEPPLPIEGESSPERQPEGKAAYFEGYQDALKDRAPEGMVLVPRSFLEATPCPNCDGSGFIVNTGPDPQQEQCQWCFEKHMILSAHSSTKQPIQGETE